MRTVSTVPASRRAGSYTLHFRADEYAAVKASAARDGLSIREWLTRTVSAALSPAVVAERALARTLEEVAT
jgi:hypothetical protein